MKNRNRLLVSLFVFLCAFSVYLTMLPMHLTWANYGGDGGDFLAAVLTHGVPHPTGYPTYMLISRLFQKIRFGTPYYRGALLSAVFTALSAALLFNWILVKLNNKYGEFSSLFNIHNISAVLGSLIWVFAPVVWSQAVIVEVHGLQSFFFVISLYWLDFLLSKEEKKNCERPYNLLFALLFGLGLGNHVTLIFLFPVILILFWLKREQYSKRYFCVTVLFLLLGLSVYSFIPFWSQNNPPVNWGNPKTIKGFLWLVTGSPYQTLLFNVSAKELFGSFISRFQSIINQVGIYGMVLCIIGASEESFRKEKINIALLWIVFIYFVFSLQYQVRDADIYLIPAIMVISIWIAYGMIWISRIPKWDKINVGNIILGLVMVFSGAKIVKTYEIVNPMNDKGASIYAETVLRSVPEAAIILTKEDSDTFPLWYYHYGLGERPDIRIVVLSLLPYDWYRYSLESTYQALAVPDREPWEDNIRNMNSEAPFCWTTSDPSSAFGIKIDCLSK